MAIWLKGSLASTLFLLVAAFLEAFGDSLFQSGMQRSAGWARLSFFLAGAGVLSLYGLAVNVPRWNFGRLLGVYVVLFFLFAQVMAKIRFHQDPTVAVYVGGSLIAAGGLVIALWQG